MAISNITSLLEILKSPPQPDTYWKIDISGPTGISFDGKFMVKSMTIPTRKLKVESGRSPLDSRIVPSKVVTGVDDDTQLTVTFYQQKNSKLVNQLEAYWNKVRPEGMNFIYYPSNYYANIIFTLFADAEYTKKVWGIKCVNSFPSSLKILENVDSAAPALVKVIVTFDFEYFTNE